MSAPFEVTTENFQTEVVGSDVPVLLDFWATWCGPCKSIAPVLDELAAQFDGRMRVGKVNVDEQGVLSQAFGVRSIPTLAVVVGGEIVHVEAGFKGKAAVAALFRLHARP
jgi:thioredoxin 1